MSGTLVRAALMLAVVGATAASAQAPGSALVIGETFTIQSQALGETRRLNVYRPPGCAAPADPACPVLYMPDGGIQEDFIHVAGIVQVSVGNGTMRPFIVVGIENTARRRDMTGPTNSAEDKRIAPVVGGSAAFRRFIRDELMPAVRARYRVTDEDAIVGESLAGLFVLETLFEEPGVFDTYIAFDPSLWWNNSDLVNRAASRLDALAGRQVWVAHSDQKEIAELTRRLADVFARGAPATMRWHLEPMPEESHATIYHPAALRAFRRFFAPGKAAK
jgi:uncharacterized protein